MVYRLDLLVTGRAAMSSPSEPSSLLKALSSVETVMGPPHPCSPSREPGSCKSCDETERPLYFTQSPKPKAQFGNSKFVSRNHFFNFEIRAVTAALVGVGRRWGDGQQYKGISRSGRLSFLSGHPLLQPAPAPNNRTSMAQSL